MTATESATKEGYNAFWNAYVGEIPYADVRELREAWLLGYHLAEYDISIGNY